jgi:hypothetical protein
MKKIKVSTLLKKWPRRLFPKPPAPPNPVKGCFTHAQLLYYLLLLERSKSLLSIRKSNILSWDDLPRARDNRDSFSIKDILAYILGG